MQKIQPEFIPVLSLSSRDRGIYAQHLARQLGARVVDVDLGEGIPTAEVLEGVLDDVGGASAVVLNVCSCALATEVIGALSQLPVTLSRLIGVLPDDATDILNSEAELMRTHDGGGAGFVLPKSVALLSILEYATTLVLRPEAMDVLEFACAVNPQVEYIIHPYLEPGVLPPSVGDLAERIPGWLLVVNTGLTGPVSLTGKVWAFRYVRERPFHPGRLMTLLESDTRYGALERVAGFSRIASRPGVINFWDAIGETISIDPFQVDWWAADTNTVEGYFGDGTDLEVSSPGGVNDDVVGQDIVVIGTDLDWQLFEDKLDACLLTDSEFLGGPMLWRTFDESVL